MKYLAILVGAFLWLLPGELQAQTTFCGQFNMPCWITANRPSPAGAGTFGYNTTIGAPEWFTGSSWISALVSLTGFTGVTNTAFGTSALNSITVGANNTAVGVNALTEMVGGVNNVAVGLNALALATGNNSTAIGTGALSDATTSILNTALGSAAGSRITTGSNNLLLGQQVASTVTALTTGSRNILIGTSGNCNVDTATTTDQFRVCGSTPATTHLMTGNLVDGALNLQMGGSLQLKTNTAATVLAITCNAAAEGRMFAVTDASSVVFNAALVGGGANHMIGYCNGTAWVVR